MAEAVTEETRTYPDSTFKFPRAFGNLSNASAYPPWKPVDTLGETSRVFRFSFYTTVGAYAWLYFWKRTTFKLGLPLTVVGFATVTTATKGILTNLREKNDGWNMFWAVGMGNLAALTAGFKNMPVKHKVLTGISGAALTAFVDHWYWAQSTSYAGKDTRHKYANVDEDLPKQQFWDVWRRRPLSQTVEEMGAGRGIFKP
ncbi:Piso0_001176 [Millerozyma farinosa CBS 7064]|uniref:Piso0_001176 protein n=1 Tax=Pichia sorbitophila (strain ATCC MYA-4447 / BCRC 22081 / CBS 7064 / NBRC 10061 / NRRL Y-12695) TaxID=559304 RepID=G8YPG5_PICSO|nr:Piso0_001176 [Millerozyma farinosa CBS 7064]CCE79136.1 Piso0_001176 [Millerozyma farinosa CBS 7064]